MILKFNVASSHIKFCGSSEAPAPWSAPENTLYSLKRGGNGAGASELPHIVMELNAS